MTVRFEGTAGAMSFNEPTIIGRFFGSNALLLFVDADSEIKGVSGKPMKWIPVRLECYFRTPDFNGRRVAVAGEFDDFDRVFRATSIEVVGSDLWIGAAKRHGVVASCLWVISLVVIQWIALLVVAGVAAEWFQTIRVAILEAENGGNNEAVGNLVAAAAKGIIGSVTLYALLAMMIGVVFVYLQRTCVPTIIEAIDRVLRRHTEHRPN